MVPEMKGVWVPLEESWILLEGEWLPLEGGWVPLDEEMALLYLLEWEEFV